MFITEGSLMESQKKNIKSSSSFKNCFSQESCQYNNTYFKKIKILHILSSNVAGIGHHR